MKANESYQDHHYYQDTKPGWVVVRTMLAKQAEDMLRMATLLFLPVSDPISDASSRVQRDRVKRFGEHVGNGERSGICVDTKYESCCGRENAMGVDGDWESSCDRRDSFLEIGLRFGTMEYDIGCRNCACNATIAYSQ